MEGKKKYFAIILFLVLGLMIFTFANPDEEALEENGVKENEVGEVSKEKTEDESSNDTLGVEETTTNNETNTYNIRRNTTTNTTTATDDSYDKALASVILAENELTSTSVSSAEVLVNQVSDNTKKDELTERLETVKETINAKELVEELEKLVNESTTKSDMDDSRDYRDTNEIVRIVSELTNDTVKTDLESRLRTLSKVLDDESSPVLEGIDNNAFVNTNVQITSTDDNEVTLTSTLNGEIIAFTDTFEQEGTYTVTAVDAAYNETTVTFTIDKTNPEFVGLKSGSHYETIKVEVEDATETTVEIKNMDTGLLVELDETNTLTEDATYYITATDKAGNETSIYVAIDSKEPTITGVTDGSFVNTKEHITVKDKFLTLVKITRTTANGEEVRSFTRSDFEVGARNENFAFSKNVSTEGTYTIYAEDKFGNTNEVTFTIDKTAPTLEITKSNNDKSTNKDVTVTLTTNEKIATPEGWTEVVEGYSFTKVYSENGKYEVTVKDLAGNETTEKFEVKRIDKVAPTATVTMSNNNGYTSTNEDVTVTIVANEAIYRPEGWTEVNTNKEHEFTKVYSENGKYEVIITDKAGNETIVKFEVKRIDKVAPVITVIDPNRYQLEAGSTYVDKGYSAYDAVDKDVTKLVKISYQFQAKGSSNWKVVNKLDTTKIGTYKLTYTAYDKAGNSSKGTRVVQIVDTINPTLEVKEDTIGNDPYYSRVSFKLSDSNLIDKFTVNGKEFDRTDAKYSDANYQNIKSALQEGENTITLYDTAGNQTTKVFYMDWTTAKISSSNILVMGDKNEQTTFWATNGDEIYAYITVSEKLATIPTFTFHNNGKDFAATSTSVAGPDADGKYVYKAFLKITEDLDVTDGQITVSATNITDKAGNITNDVTEPTNGHIVMIDRTAPRLVVKNTSVGTDPYYSRLDMQAKDKNLEYITINGTKYSARVDINDGSIQSYWNGTNTVTAVDKAGNVTTKTFIIDRSVKLESSNYAITYLTEEDEEYNGTLGGMWAAYFNVRNEYTIKFAEPVKLTGVKATDSTYGNSITKTSNDIVGLTTNGTSLDDYATEFKVKYNSVYWFDIENYIKGDSASLIFKDKSGNTLEVKTAVRNNSEESLSLLLNR